MPQGLPYHHLLPPWQTVIPLSQTITIAFVPTHRQQSNLTSAAINTPNGTAALAQYGKVFNYTQCDYAVGLRNWLGSLCHSISVDVNGTTVVQATSFIGMVNCFNMITSFSYADFTEWASIGFYPDSSPSVTFNGTPTVLSSVSTPFPSALPSTAAVAGTTVNGVGSANNVNCQTGFSPGFAGGSTGQTGGATYSTAIACPTQVTNIGLLKRQQYWMFDPAQGPFNNGVIVNSLLSQSNLNLSYKSYVFNKQNAIVMNGATYSFQQPCWQQAIVGIIKLKQLHSFFAEMPLMKGIFFKMTLNLNQTYLTFTTGDAKQLTCTQMNSPLGGVSPLMIASAATFTGTGAGVTTYSGSAGLPINSTFVLSIAVGKQCLCPLQTSGSGWPTTTVQPSPLLASIMLSVPSYTFNPVFEQSYLSQPVKTVIYNDTYQYFVQNVPPQTNFNQLVTNGIANIQSVLVLPYYTASANGGIDPIQSPFSTEGSGTTSPYALIGNFQVVVSGQQMIYVTEKFTYEQYLQQLYGCNAVNGGMNDGVNSGLINQTDFETCYQYYYVNCARKLPIESSVPMSVNIQGTNYSSLPVNYYVFITYQMQINLDVLTGSRV